MKLLLFILVLLNDSMDFVALFKFPFSTALLLTKLVYDAKE